MILHALDATANSATQLQIHSPDKDVFVLALRRYPELCENTLFVTGRGQHHRIIELKPIAETLGPEKIAALPAFHALTGSDNTATITAALWMADGPRRMGTCHDKPATSP